MMPPMSARPQLISVILSTYNMPDWLEKSLVGYAAQDHRDFEIVIADDGSTEDTAHVVERFKRESSLQIKHVWHTDDGFRKCAILNRAINRAEGDYLLFSDGDCIPRSDFVRQHFEAAKPQHFLSGGYYKLPMSLSKQLTREDIESGNAFSATWLRQQGLPFSHRLLRLAAQGTMARVLNHLTTTRPTWNGHNASGWTSDVVDANGFDERMRYGGEDRELGERLVNAGIRPIQIRYQAVCLHLDHARGYIKQVDLDNNARIREITRAEHLTFTDHGIDQLKRAA